MHGRRSDEVAGLGDRWVWPDIALRREAYACSRRGWRWSVQAGDEIRVNTVHPGVIDTPIWTKLPVSAGGNAPIGPHEIASSGVPLGKAGQAQDLKWGALLTSDASDYMTGAELVITGACRAARDSAELSLPWA